MNTYKINVGELPNLCKTLNAGDKVLLSGTVYTARDAAHLRIDSLLNSNDSLPFELNGAVIYYAGPTPAPQGFAIGSCGPTTSCRMDSFTPRLLDLGVAATIGKGKRSREVIDAIIRNKSVYLCAIGGAGALAAQSVTECEIIAFPELGCESVKKLTVKDFPLFVGIDSHGNTILK